MKKPGPFKMTGMSFKEGQAPIKKINLKNLGAKAVRGFDRFLRTNLDGTLVDTSLFGKHGYKMSDKEIGKIFEKKHPYKSMRGVKGKNIGDLRKFGDDDSFGTFEWDGDNWNQIEE
tara:strand:- start:258 stop:605 length:348 start_codon:yes stop_codon:yes gene_type:complete